MKKVTLSPHMEELFNQEDKEAILNYINRQVEMLKLKSSKDQYFAIRKSNGLSKYTRIDVFVNKYNIVSIFEIQEKD